MNFDFLWENVKSFSTTYQTCHRLFSGLCHSSIRRATRWSLCGVGRKLRFDCISHSFEETRFKSIEQGSQILDPRNVFMRPDFISKTD
jgi:hypothetical protein